MTSTAIILIVTSAFLHAGWNYASKRREPSLAFFLVTNFAAVLLTLPLLVYFWHTFHLIPASIWRLVVATGVAQMVYFLGLAGAYRNGDLSLAYPVARSLPVLFVAAFSLAAGRGSEIGTVSLAGMILIAAGCLVIPLDRFSNFKASNYLNATYLMAIVAALGTTGYTLIDSFTLQQLRDISPPTFSNLEITLLFVLLQTLSTTMMIAITTFAIPGERRNLVVILKSRKSVLRALGTGCVILITYGLVLVSMLYVKDVSYVAAFRQLSIPIGALLGMTLQNEPRYIPKITGILMVIIGLFMVATH